MGVTYFCNFVIMALSIKNIRIVTVRQAKPDFMSVTEGIKGDALKFGFFIMREFSQS